MLLYVNGDSFSAGSGLYDSEYVTNFDYYKSKLSGNDKSLYTEYMAHRSECLNVVRLKSPNEDVYMKLYSQEKERSWVNKLSKLLGANVINSSEGGSSTSAILYRTVLDLNDLRKKGNVPDLVIIHLTDPARIALIRENRVHNYRSEHNWIQSLLLSMPHDDKEITQLLNATLLLQNDSELTLKMFLEIMLIRSTVKEMTGKYPILTTTSAYIRDEVALALSKVTSFKDVVESSTVRLITDKQVMTRYVYTDEDRLPCGHFTENVNNKFADGILAYLKENNVI